MKMWASAPFALDRAEELWEALVEWRRKEDGSIGNLKRTMRDVCLHRNVETDDYLNPCANAACHLSGPPGTTYHLGCGSQHKDYCADCGEILYDSAEDEINNAEWEEVLYVCQRCEAEGIQPGHKYCGQKFLVPFPKEEEVD